MELASGKDAVFVYDNERRNKEIVNRIEKAIDKGFEVVIWPENLEEKDLNDMFMAGHDVQSLVEFNTYSGLEAHVKLTEMEKGMKEIYVVVFKTEIKNSNLDKIHIMVEHACRGLAGVSESQVEMNANLQFFDGIETSDIQEILIRSANDLISLDAPNYQFVAARLLLFGLRKAVYNGHPDGHPPLKEHVLRCVGKGVYDKQF